MNIVLIMLTLLVIDSPQFRGPNRDGSFPDEQNLLKEWPAEGPKMMWANEQLGHGFASVSVVDGMIYTTGMKGDEASIYTLDLEGNLKWRKVYGKADTGGGYPGTRSTPTIVDGKAYVMSISGVLLCFDAKTGEEVWRVPTLERFAKGREDRFIPTWGISESVLVDGDRVIVTPGAPDAGLAAFHRLTGEEIWRTKGLGDISGYCSPTIFEAEGLRQVITMTGKAMVGVDPESGELLWRQPYPGSYDIHAVTPVFDGRRIYVSDGYGQGGTLFELSKDGRSVRKIWQEKKLDIHHGGAVLIDGHVYGASSKGRWMVLSLDKGEVLKEMRVVGKGSVITADGMIYGYGERGTMGLFKPGPEAFELVSSFKITLGRGQHWAHPVISNGVLYVRHGEVLMAFDIRG